MIDDFVQEQSEFDPQPKKHNKQRPKIKALEKLIEGEENPLLKIDHEGLYQPVLDPE